MPDSDNTAPLSAVVIGARTQRQGTGPFIAAGLQAAGVSVAGIVGTSPESVAIAEQELADKWQLRTRGYTDLDTAISTEQPDAVAICSPWQVHAGQLRAVASAGRHCLVEKPLAWPADEAEIDQLVSAFEQRGLLLQMVNQWPTTLPAFGQLHGTMPENIEQFSMRLSPISIGPDMVTDSAPHFIGMLQALAGAGDCQHTVIEKSSGEELQLSCHYTHAGGSIQASLILKTQQQRPRPAWYQINDLRADREVELPDYQQFLTCGERRIPLTDPMHLVTGRFARGLVNGDATRGDELRAAHRNLLQLAAAWR